MDNKIQNKKVIIIGCGIAGPSLAIMLKKIGMDSEIYESEKNTPDFGILSFTPNAVRSVKILGINDRIQADPSPNAYFYKHNGKLLETPDMISELKKAKINEGMMLRRSHVIQTLIQKAKEEEIPIHFGKKLVDISEENDQVVAIFSDGTQVKGDFLIGCDGPFSKTRKITLPDSSPPTYTGRIWTGGDVGNSVQHDWSPNAFHMTFGKNAYSGTLVFSDKKTVWWTNVPCPVDKLQEFKTLSFENLTQKLLELHKDDHELISKFIESTKNKHVRIPLYVIPHLDTWHKGRICLIGDAAHATSPFIGQGAAMAMEDAIILAKCLRDIPDLNKAFEKFEKLRKKRTEKIVKTSEQSGKFMTSTNPILKLFKRRLLSYFIKSYAKNLDWIFSHDMNWDEKVK